MPPACRASVLELRTAVHHPVEEDVPPACRISVLEPGTIFYCSYQAEGVDFFFFFFGGGSVLPQAKACFAPFNVFF